MEKLSEHQAQSALFKTVKMHEAHRPELALLFAIPNGGHRNKLTAVKLKQEGVKAGVLDTCLPVARGGWHGAFIELKVGSNKPTPEQKEWIKNLMEQGYYCAVHWDWSQAFQCLIDYLDGKIAK